MLINTYEFQDGKHAVTSRFLHIYNRFKGSLEDLLTARRSAEAFAAASGATRPALLRKDFVMHTHHVLEARAFGADCVLLIVACDAAARNLERESYVLVMVSLGETECIRKGEFE